MLLLVWQLALAGLVVVSAVLGGFGATWEGQGLHWSVPMPIVVVPIVILTGLVVAWVIRDRRQAGTTVAAGWTSTNTRKLAMAIALLPVAIVLFRLGTNYNWVTAVAILVTIPQWLLLLTAFPDSARAARLQAEGALQAMDALRDQRGVPWLDDLARDVRHGLRTLRRSPGYTAVALVTLALGIGANTTLFSIVNGVILQPLVSQKPEQLMRLTARFPVRGSSGVGLSNREYVEFRELNRSFAHVGAFCSLTFTASERWRREWDSSNFAASPLGRDLIPVRRHPAIASMQDRRARGAIAVKGPIKKVVEYLGYPGLPRCRLERVVSIFRVRRTGASVVAVAGWPRGQTDQQPGWCHLVFLVRRTAAPCSLARRPTKCSRPRMFSNSSAQ